MQEKLDPALSVRETLRSVAAELSMSRRDRERLYDEALTPAGESLFRKYYPRKYAAPGGYCSPKIAAYDHIQNMMAVHESTLHDKILVQLAATGARLAEIGMPTYWVKRDLAEALMRTVTPPGITPADVQWPIGGCQFMLPYGLYMNSDGASFRWVCYALIPKGWRSRKFGPIWLANMRDEEGIAIAACDTNEVGWSSWMPMSAVMDTLKEKDFTAQMEMHTGPTIVPGGALEMSKLNSFVINIVLYMLQRPENERMLNSDELPESDVVRAAKPAKNIDALWRPRWVGEHYHRKRSDSKGGTHASPRVHWRLGHFREQKHGPNNSLTKRIWIEDVMVNACS